LGAGDGGAVVGGSDEDEAEDIALESGSFDVGAGEERAHGVSDEDPGPGVVPGGAEEGPIAFEFAGGDGEVAVIGVVVDDDAVSGVLEGFDPVEEDLGGGVETVDEADGGSVGIVGFVGGEGVEAEARRGVRCGFIGRVCGLVAGEVKRLGECRLAGAGEGEESEC
jgi:hypothetical protein